MTKGLSTVPVILAVRLCGTPNEVGFFFNPNIQHLLFE